MTRPKPPSPPVIGDGVPNRHSGHGNKPVRRVVVHSAVMPCEPGRARQLGQMNQTSTTGSWHYAVDPAETFQCSWDSVVCWHAPPNSHSLGIEMSDDPRLGGQRWERPAQQAMLQRTAKLVAQLCAAYGLPPRYRTPLGLRLGRRGWTTHNNVSKAWGQSTHWDPGVWPRRKFARMVRQHHAALMREART